MVTETWQPLFPCRVTNLLGLPVDRLMRSEHALHRRVSLASPPHLHTGVVVVPQLEHLCKPEAHKESGTLSTNDLHQEYLASLKVEQITSTWLTAVKSEIAHLSINNRITGM